MDEGYFKAVFNAFVKLYEKGLIYRGHRLVNWCPVSKSAISDEEVIPVSYSHLRAHETEDDIVCRLLLEKKYYTPLSPRNNRGPRLPSSA